MKLKLYLRILIVFIFSIVILLVSTRIIYKNMIGSSLFQPATDSIFSKNTWNNYMVGLISSKDNTHRETDLQEILTRLNVWEDKQLWYQKYQIRGIIEYCHNCDYQTYVNELTQKEPPYINSQLLPYKLVFFPKQKSFIFLLNHYYCDGKILHDFIVFILLDNKKSSVNFVKYKYLPIFSDFLLIGYILKSLKRNLFYQRSLLSVHSKSLVVSKKIEGSYFPKLNRWNVLGFVLELLFKYLSVPKLSIAFTVGIDDNCDFGNNRIGCIVLDIKPLNNYLEYADYLKKNLIANQYDALVSYDLLRNFPTQKLRKMFNKKIDLVLTSFKIDYSPNMDVLSYDVGSIIGVGKLPLYVISMTIDKIVNICIKSSTQQFDYYRFLKNEDNSKLNFYWGYTKSEMHEFLPSVEETQELRTKERTEKELVHNADNLKSKVDDKDDNYTQEEINIKKVLKVFKEKNEHQRSESQTDESAISLSV